MMDGPGQKQKKKHSPASDKKIGERKKDARPKNRICGHQAEKMLYLFYITSL
jgi:hypothetical protein